MRRERLGVVLFQLGGPDSLAAIEPFLFNLFCDPDIIDFPFARIGRKPLAKLISTTRARKVQHHYAVIGGASPIRRHTERQATALEAELNARGYDAKCVVAMRYWHPFTDEAVRELEAFEPDEIVLLPLYPQYSTTTTGSSLNEWRRVTSAAKAAHPIAPYGGRERPPLRNIHAGSGNTAEHVVQDFYREPLYLHALVEKIDAALARFVDGHRPVLVFSAHSVPLSVIERGDPYQRQIEETVALVRARGGWANEHRLCYQSKVGASSWLQPSLRTTVRELGASGVEEVCVVPISFVSDHVETLGEIDHEARELAAACGIRRFELMDGLNDSPTFIAALAAQVMTAVGAEIEEAVAAD
jgi:ferrochelatase